MLVIWIAIGVVILGLIVSLFFLLKDKKAKGNAAQKKVGKFEEDPMAALKIEDIGKEVLLPDLKSSEYETDEITTGIDVSEFQGNIDWKSVADAGIDFAMIRVGYRGMSNGRITEDACARYNLQEAAANGLKIGAYFFSTAITEKEAREEAKWTSNILAGYPITYPVAYNCEGFKETFSRQYDLSAKERTRLANAFTETVEENHYVGMFYAAKSELEGNSLWNADALALKYRTWVAQYTEVPW